MSFFLKIFFKDFFKEFFLKISQPSQLILYKMHANCFNLCIGKCIYILSKYIKNSYTIKKTGDLRSLFFKRVIFRRFPGGVGRTIRGVRQTGSFWLRLSCLCLSNGGSLERASGPGFHVPSPLHFIPDPELKMRLQNIVVNSVTSQQFTALLATKFPFSPGDRSPVSLVS